MSRIKTFLWNVSFESAPYLEEYVEAHDLVTMRFRAEDIMAAGIKRDGKKTDFEGFCLEFFPLGFQFHAWDHDGHMLKMDDFEEVVFYMSHTPEVLSLPPEELKDLNTRIVWEACRKYQEEFLMNHDGLTKPSVFRKIHFTVGD